MIKNHIKIAWRSLFRRKTLSAIHIVGLAVALATTILLFMTAMFELSFDNFHKEKERIGLVYTKTQPGGTIRNSATFSAPIASLLKSELPDVEYASRYQSGGVVLRHGDKQLESNNKYVDTDFFSIFTFPMLHGDNKALESLDNIVIDETMANSLFNSTEVVGEQVEVYAQGRWQAKTISAVMERTPANSSFNFQTLLRFEQKPDYLAYKDDWGHEDHNVFVKVKPAKLDQLAFSQAARPFVQLYYKDSHNMLKRDGAVADENGDYISLQVLPMGQYHLNDLGLGNGGSPRFPWILLLIAGLVLFTACSNFINLSLANSLARNREIGTRKTLGGSVRHLVGQLSTESFLLCAFALLIGVGLAWLILPEYNANMNYNLRIGQLFSPANLLVFVLVFLALTLVSGGYPAWRIARANIVQTLKGSATVSANGLRNGLTVVQFSIAIALIMATIVIGSQLHYIANRPLGFDKSEVISIPIGSGIDQERALQQMRVELASQPWVQGVSASDINIGRGRDGNMSTSRFGFEHEGRQIYTNFMRIDYDYLQTLGINLFAGRDFDRSFGTDTASVIVNKQMAEQLGGIEKILGRNINMDGNPQVIGVIDDFNFQNLRRKVEPLTLSINPNIFPVEYIFVRVKTDNLSESIKNVEDIWKGVNPEANVSPSYLDENTQNLYRTEQRFSRIVISGAIVAIVISCLGLFALSLLMINRRVKEIGIRKVLGSSVPEIVALLSKDFIKLVLISLLIASPIAWWAMNKWLEDFAYRIEIQWWMFAGAGLAAMVIALLTVSWQAVRAAVANPVDSLRDE